MNELRREFYCRNNLRHDSSAQSGKFARPGSKASYGPDQNFDAQHILLDLALDFSRKTLSGKCTTTVAAIVDGSRNMEFDAVGLKIESVALADGTRLKYSHDGEKCKVALPKPLSEGERTSVIISYKLVNPVAGVYFIEPDRAYPNKPRQAWTHGEAEESRYWFPCFDAPHDKATTEMIVSVPKGFFALSNGELLDRRDDNKKNATIFHWKQGIAHSPYLVTLVAGKFSEIKDEWDGIPIQYYCQPGREQECKRAFGKTPRMVKFFSESIGVRYPYEKYAQIAVADFVMGGMEHTTATTQTDRVLMDAKAHPEFTADWLVSHELAHQWFGDLLTCKEWSHAWLNESFATYFEALFTEHDLGKDEFEYEMYDKLELYRDEDKKVYRRAIVTNFYRKPDDLFDRHLYEKGSLVLHSLRHILGDKLFWKAIGHYVRTYQGKAVETSDLINSIQESTGRNMRKFFDQFVFAPGHPEFTVDYWWEEKTKTAHVRVLQKTSGKNSFSSAPVEIEFITSGGRKKYTVTLEEKKHEFKYRFASEPLDVRFDPGHKVLMSAEVRKPYKMWLSQLRTDSHSVGRIQAAKQIAALPTDESLNALTAAFQREKFWGAAKEIALAIGRIGSEKAMQFLIRSCGVKHPKVRRGVVEALGQFKAPAASAKLREVFQRDPSYFVRAEAIRSLSAISPEENLKWTKKALATPSWNDTIRAGALQSLIRIPSAENIRTLRALSRYGAHPSSRGSAVQAFAKLAKSFPGILDELIALTQDKQVRVKQAAISALGGVKNPKAVAALQKISKDKNLPYRTRALADDAILKINPEPSDA